MSGNIALPKIPRSKRMQGITFDINELERKVRSTKNYLQLKNLHAPRAVLAYFMAQTGTTRPEYYAEMDLVMNHAKEKYGYSIKHLPSGRSVFVLTALKDNIDGSVDMSDLGEFATDELAREYLKKEGIESYILDEIDNQDWWGIIGPDEKNHVGVFPTFERAVIFLLREIWDKVPEWQAFIRDLYNKKAAGEPSDPSVVDDFVMDVKNGVYNTVDFTLLMRHLAKRPYPDPKLLKSAFNDVKYAYEHLNEFGYKIEAIPSGKLVYYVTRPLSDDPDDVEDVGCFGTPEEADMACVCGNEHIEPVDPEEKYVLLTLDDRNVTGKLYDSEGAALAFVLDSYPESVPNWHKWRLLDTGYDEQLIRAEIAKSMESVMAELFPGGVE